MGMVKDRIYAHLFGEECGMAFLARGVEVAPEVVVAECIQEKLDAELGL